jgi:AcrR family transcriptional regulator
MNKTKKKLLQTYIEEVFNKGIQEVTLLSLSKSSKIPFGTVHYHLGSLDLLLAAVELADESGRDFVNNALAKTKKGSRLDQYISVNFDWLRIEPENASLWIYFLFESARKKSHAKLNQDYSHKTIIRILDFLKVDFPKKSPKELKGLAEKLYQNLFGSMVYALSHDSEHKKVLKNCLDTKNSILLAHFAKM